MVAHKFFLAHKFRMLKCKRMIFNSSFRTSSSTLSWIVSMWFVGDATIDYIANSRKFLLFLDLTNLYVNNVMFHERTHVLTFTVDMSKDSNYTQNRLHCIV